MPMLLGLLNNNSNNNNNNVSKSPRALQPDISRSSSLSKRWQTRQKITGDTGAAQEAANRNTTKPFHLVSPGEEYSPSTIELKITPPFPALRLSSLSLRTKSNPRTSRSSRSPSPIADPAPSPVLAPSPIITRTNSNGDGFLSSDSLCTGGYILEDQNSDSQMVPVLMRQLWTSQDSENTSGTLESGADTPRITISSFQHSSAIMDESEPSQQPLVGEALQAPTLTRSVSESLVNFAKRSWSSPSVSRSSSPGSRDAVSTKSGDSVITTSSTSSVPSSVNGEDNGDSKIRKPESRRGSTSSLTKSRRPISTIFGRGSASDSMVPTARSQSLSTDNSPLRLSVRKVKDELWDGFRAIESDYNK